MNDGALRNFLIDSGLVSRSQLASLEAEEGVSLSVLLVKRGILSDDEMRRALASALGIAFVTLEVDDISPDALELIPEPLARTRSAVAYRSQGDSVQVALLDLNDLEALDFLKNRFRVVPRLTTRESMKRALLFYQKLLKRKFGDQIARDVQAIVEPAPGASEELLHYSAERLPVVYVLDALVRHALAQKASHIHLEPRDEGLLIRYRLSGVLHDAMQLPRHAALPVLMRFKLLAGMSLKSTQPQEGRFRITNETENFALSVSTIASTQGERMVVRITPDSSRGFTLESLGFHGEALEEVHDALLKRKGLIAVSGPPGSGKTTLLYTLLDLLHGPHASISTIEHSREVRLPYAEQTIVDPEIGLTASAALRAALKLDPDVVMVGEVVDRDSAALVSSAAARTLVLAGYDNDSLLESCDLRVRIFRARRLCAKVKLEKHKLSRAESNLLEEAGVDFTKVLSALKAEGIVGKETQWRDMEFLRAEPCKECEGGYKGFVGLQEVGEGLNLAEDGVFKAARGLTSIDELIGLMSE